MAAERLSRTLPGPLSPDLIAQHGFATAFRGFDQSEVRELLGRVAEEVRTLRAQLDELELARRDAEDRAAHPQIGEEQLLAAVGEETAAILHAARHAAADQRARAAVDAERVVAEAQERADHMLAHSGGVLAAATEEARAAADAIRGQAEAEAAARRGEAEADAAQMLADATAAAEATASAAERDRQLTIDSAQAMREKILADLSRRRRIASVQVEQLRAGRERLLQSYEVVRRTLQEVNDELRRADSEARAEGGDEEGSAPPADLVLPDRPEPEAAGPEVPVGPQAAGPEPAGPEPAGPEPAGPEAAVSDEPGRAAGGVEWSPGPVEGMAGVEVEDEVDEAVAGVEAEAEPGPDAEADQEAGPGPESGGPEDETTAKVEGLFARIRADRQRAVAHAHQVLDVDNRPADAEDAGGVEDTDEVVVAVEAVVEVVEVEDEGEDEPGEVRSDADESALQQRDEALGEVETSLARQLKRALQDEQNDLLDRLRSTGGTPSAADLLPAPAEQEERFGRLARPALERAAAAGVSFASERLGRPARAVKVDVGPLAQETTAGIVGPLARRIEVVLAERGADEQSVLVDAIGAAYRETKTQRIERVAGDGLAAAYSLGVWEAAPKGAQLRWVVEDLDGPCPDCDDNALAGELGKGEEFPTGQRCPPAHAGCRCLLVPEPGLRRPKQALGCPG